MCAYQVVNRPVPMETSTNHGPAQAWSVRTITVPAVAASTGVPQATERSVPVWPWDQRDPVPPQLCWSTYRLEAGSGKTAFPDDVAPAQSTAPLVHAAECPLGAPAAE